MSVVRVPLWNTPGKFATVENGATAGAVIGRNVYNADGTLFAPASAPAVGDAARMSWSLIVDVPANVAGVAALATDGFMRRAGAAISAGPLAYADLPTTGAADGDALVFAAGTWSPGAGERAAVPTRIPTGTTYTVAADTQALFALPIELEGDAALIIDGALVEVA